MRYIVGVLIAIGLVILVIVVIIKLIFGGGGSPKTAQKPLTDYANTGVTVQMTIEGAVVADQNYREIVINVGQNQSYVDVFQGYQNNLLTNKTYNNNAVAYATFLRSLQFAGYTLGNPNPNLADERGRCALGNRYVFEILQGGQDLQRYWTSTCSGVKTFEGSFGLVRALFIRQIPDYGKAIQGVSLSG